MNKISLYFARLITLHKDLFENYKIEIERLDSNEK